MILFVIHFYRMKMQKMNNVVMFVIKRKKKRKNAERRNRL